MIRTCLWSHDVNALEMAEFYTSIFSDSKITTTGLYTEDNPHLPGSKAGDVMIVEFDILGVPLATLNGGAYFKLDPSISLSVYSDNMEEIDRWWNTLADGGKVLMPIDTYPWSEKYGWLQDKYGTSWQICHVNTVGPVRLIPSLMFVKQKAGKAEEAIKYYTEVFKNSGIDSIARYGAGDNDVAGYVSHAQFHIDDFTLNAMDSSGPHDFDFSCAVSFMLTCKDQEELDYFYNKLSAVPEAEQCGWVADKFGVSWQLTPQIYYDLINRGDEEKTAKLMHRIMDMKKLSVKGIEDAYYN